MTAASRAAASRAAARIAALLAALLAAFALGSAASPRLAAAAPDAEPPAVHSPAEVIFQRVFDTPDDQQALAQALAELDALIAKTPKDPIAHYARGWVLSHSGKPEDAIAAYDRAIALDKKLSSALYNAGVVLTNLGRTKEARGYFERALKADPGNIDAAYNLGQLHYDAKDFAKASKYWKIAAKLAPEDFQTAKKLVQAAMALGKAKEIEKARAVVFALHAASKDPQVAKLTSYVCDQFDVGKYHIYVYEAFDISGDLAYLYEFKVTEKDKPIGSVNLETSAVIREMGVQFLLGMNQGNKHSSFNEHQWKQRPEYKAVRKLAAEVIAARF